MPTDPLQYKVNRLTYSGGEPKPHAAFVYPRDAENFIEDEARRGPWSAENFIIVDADSGRKVTGTTTHGHAILETLRKAGKV